MRSVLQNLLVCLAVGTAATQAAAGPAPDEVELRPSVYSGTGCPEGSVSTIISPDRTVITITYDRFQVFIGPGTSPQDRSKTCTIGLRMAKPAGFQFGVVETTWHNEIVLEEGVTHNIQSVVLFSGGAPEKQSSFSTAIKGNEFWSGGGVFTKVDTEPAYSVAYSECFGDLTVFNFNTRASMTSEVAESIGQNVDGSSTPVFTIQLSLTWRECN